MHDRYREVRGCYYDAYDVPELDPLRREIASALVFGLFQAAIALTNHFLEATLKYGLIYQYAIENRQPPTSTEPTSALIESLEPAKKLYAGLETNDLINRACSRGLITKPQKKHLHRMVIRLRHAYAHADKDKLFGDSTIPVTAVHLDGDRIVVDSQTDARVADFLIAHGPLQLAHAKANALPYFLLVDDLTRQIVRKLYPNLSHEEPEDLTD